MKTIFLTLAEIVCIFLMFAVCGLLMWAGAYVLSDGLGGSPVVGWASIVVGFLSYVVFSGNIINAHA